MKALCAKLVETIHVAIPSASRYALARATTVPPPFPPPWLFALVSLRVLDTAKSGTYELTLRVSLTSANFKDIVDIKVQGASIEVDPVFSPGLFPG